MFDLALSLSWILLAQAKGPPKPPPINIYYIVGVVVILVLIMAALNYSGSKVRSIVGEPWRTLADNMDTAVNMGFFLQTPIMAGKYRGVPVRAYSRGNLLLKTYRTCLEVTMPKDVPFRIYLLGQHVNDQLGTLYGMEDLSKEIPDFTGQLLYKDVSDRAAMSLASPQVMQVLQAHPHGGIQIAGDTMTFETSTILADPNVMIELFRWLIEMSKYTVQLS